MAIVTADRITTYSEALFDFSIIRQSYDYNTPSVIHYSTADYFAMFEGNEFEYANDRPVDGLAHRFTYRAYDDYDHSSLEITGAKLDMAEVSAAGRTLGRADDAALMRKALAGNDTFLTHAGNDVIFGYGGNDLIKSYGGADKLSGGSGDDRLLGGAGNDQLTGGYGADGFSFRAALNTAFNTDVISDFASGQDTLRLADWLFASLGDEVEAGEFRSAASAAYASARDADDHLIYNRYSGEVFYDRDGVGGADKVRFAVLSGGPDGLAFDDFLIVA